MRAFSELYDEIDTTTSTNLKVDAMARYFRNAAPADAAWAAYILSGRRPKRFIEPATLMHWLIEASGIPQWLVDEAHASVGDLAESIALLMETDAARDSIVPDVRLSTWIDERILPLRDATEDRQREEVVMWWQTLPYRECFLVNKLLTGSLHVGVSEPQLTSALSEVLNISRTDVVRKLMGDWKPSAEFWAVLKSSDVADLDPSTPYPFYLASALGSTPSELGDISTWLVEWKWDGIRGQLIRRNGQCFMWSRGDEVVTDRFPEVAAAAAGLPDGTVLDGELVVWRNGTVHPFAELQQRIGRKKLSAQILEDVPVRFLAYDLIEYEGDDLRALPLRERREKLQAVLTGLPEIIRMSPAVAAVDWRELETIRDQSRSRGVEGLMLKSLDSPYGTGRQRGSWWKWKIDPYSFDGVMLYAQPGHGRRSNLYTDYTFGVWRGGELVPVAKAYSGLNDREIEALDRWIRAHTQEKFGPVRKVEPSQVFELAFEGIAASARHKSGITLRLPRILRWRVDKPAPEADSIENLHDVLKAHGERA